ncbi:MAG: type II toxin-antitoxin system Phd/YefM family antitoxin [Bacilli bacterium]|nr:type II toxin-antitoxin system Phd/YefM family antitoxin [Bacilli bacterium]MDY4052833.1 type II toxin-antitoxin system Phd/YefM family antitoxin [Bacilli bacterium]
MMNYNVNITNARKNLYKLTDMVIDNGVVVNITTKHGNAVLISADEYNSLLETLYLSENAEYKKTLIDGKEEKIKDLIDEKDIKW